MTGYSATPLERKLGVRDGVPVFLDHAPEGFDLEAITTRRLPRTLELTLTFHTRAAALERRFPELVRRTTPAGAIWVCWPKRASKVPTDLDDAVVRRLGLAGGMVDVKVCAVDEVWSGLKFVRRLADRPTHESALSRVFRRFSKPRGLPNTRDYPSKRGTSRRPAQPAR